jgi:kynurenine formamidase
MSNYYRAWRSRNFREPQFSYCQQCPLSAKSTDLIESQSISAIGIEPISALSELQTLRTRDPEKTNGGFALLADIRFFENPTHCQRHREKQSPGEGASVQ